MFFLFVLCCCFCLFLFCFLFCRYKTALGPTLAQRGQKIILKDKVFWFCAYTAFPPPCLVLLLFICSSVWHLGDVWILFGWFTLKNNKKTSYQNNSLKSSSFLFVALVFVAFWSGLGSNKSSASNKSGRHVCLCNLHMFIGSLAQLFRI